MMGTRENVNFVPGQFTFICAFEDTLCLGDYQGRELGAVKPGRQDHKESEMSEVAV